MVKTIKEARKYLAGRIVAESNTESAQILAYNENGECEGCKDALERNGGIEKGKCEVCSCCPYICSSNGKMGLVAHLRHKSVYGQIIGSRKWKLLVWEAKRAHETGETDLEAYVKKAEELGLGEIVGYWKAKLCEEKIKKLETIINELVS